MKSKSTRFAILAASTLAITFVHATDYNWLGVTGVSADTAAFGWGNATNWDPNGTPGSVDNIVASRDMIPNVAIPVVNNTLTARYAVTPELGTTVRTITSLTFDDSDLTSNNIVTFAPGVAGAQLEFSTDTPVISTNITNLSSSTARLVVQNPLFSQPSTTFTKGGTGCVELDFFVPGGVTAFNSNVTSLACSSGGDLRLSNAATATTLNLPTIDFSTNNNRLMLTGVSPQAVNSGVDINTGTNELAIGGAGNVTFNSGATLTGTGVNSGVTLAPGNSTYHYMNGNATLNWNGATGNGGRLRMGDGLQQSSTSTVNFNMQAGTFNINEAAGNSYVGASNRDGQIQNLNLTVSGGSLSFTNATTGDFHFGQSTRNSATVPGTLCTVNSVLTVSGSGVLDLGTGTRLALGRRNATNTIININADIKLDGGELKSAREIARSTIGTGAGTTVARVFLNGGKLTTTAGVTNLFTNFGTGTGLAADGVFVSAGGAVIDTNGFNSGIAANLQENPSSVGGGITKTGIGTLTLTGANSYSGSLVVNAGALTVSGTNTTAADSLVNYGTLALTSVAALPNSDIQLGVTSGTAGATFQLSSTAPLTYARDFTVNKITTGNALIQTSNTTGTDILSGVLTLNGDLCFNQATGGTLQIDNAIAGTGGLRANIGNSGYYGTINLAGGGSFGPDAAYFSACAGTLNITAPVTANLAYVLNVGWRNDIPGFMNITGTSVTLSGTATVGMGGGYNCANDGTGTLTVSGTAGNPGLLDLGTTAGNFLVGVASLKTGSGTLNLGNYGTLATKRAITLRGYSDGNTGALNFDGGTIKLTGGQSNIIMAPGTFPTTVTINAGGATIDTQTFDGGIAVPLLAGTGTGGLTKLGSGTLTLGATNTYIGDTTVTEGTLTASVNTALPGDSTVRIPGSGTPLNLNFAVGTPDVVNKLYINGVEQAAGLWGATGNTSATYTSPQITGTGLLSVTNGAAAGNYTTWASAHSVTGGANGDSDNDGIPNLVEYALDLNFEGSDGSPGTFDGTTLTFNKRLEAYNNGDVTYVIEESTDLGGADPWTPVSPTTDNQDEISYDLSGPAARNFARFKTVVAP